MTTTPDAADAQPISTVAARREHLIDYFAGEGGIRPPGTIELLCRLRRSIWSDEEAKHLERLLEDPHGDMFWMLPTAMLVVEGRASGVLPESAVETIRSLWKTYTPYRGDTENHWLMYHASLFIMAEQFPDGDRDLWFNGRSSSENLTEARSYLEHWAYHTFDEGQTEFDSPHYLSFFLAPLAMLFGYARDEQMRNMAETMLTLFIADFAADQLNGLYVGAFSRIYPEPTLERWRNGSTTYAWLLFGNIPLRPDSINRILPRIGYRPHGMAAVLALSGYEPPAVIERIANERPNVARHLERHHTRRRLRYAQPVEPIRKTAYLTKEFAVGSVQGGILQPIQQHTWEVLWKTPQPFDGYNVLFTVHPYSNPKELGMYFPEEPLLATAQLAKSEKPTYDQPGKWTGGSPFERVFQLDDTVVALYDIPPGERFGFISGYFSRRLEIVESESSPWLIAAADEVLIGYYPLAPFAWHDEPGGDRRLHSPHVKNGAVVITVARAAYLDGDAFRVALENTGVTFSRYPTPRVTLVTLSGDTLACDYISGLTVNGKKQQVDAWPRYGGDFMGVTPDGDISIAAPESSDDPIILGRASLALT